MAQPSSPSWRAPADVKTPPREARCAGCGNWIATAPAGADWVRARCGNTRYNGVDGRKCPQYSRAQTIKFR